MICENCSCEYNESYGSGRFCCLKCARSFSTKNKRQEINKKVSKKLKGIKRHISIETRQKISLATKGKSKKRYSVPLQQRLIKNSNYNRGHLKRRLISEGVLKNQCSECKILPEWNHKTLIMVLDHVNGINNDNRLENLRLLCPNCNSQTSTFCRKNSRLV